MPMYNIRAQKPDSNIRTMEGMRLENRVHTMPQLLAWNKCSGKWAACLQINRQSSFFSLKAIGNEDGFIQKIKTIPIGENARQVRTSDMEFGMKIEPGEVVTPLENSQFSYIYRPLRLGKREEVSKLLNRQAYTHKPLTPKIVEHPAVEPIARQSSFYKL